MKGYGNAVGPVSALLLALICVASSAQPVRFQEVAVMWEGDGLPPDHWNIWDYNATSTLALESKEKLESGESVYNAGKIACKPYGWGGDNRDDIVVAWEGYGTSLNVQFIDVDEDFDLHPKAQRWDHNMRNNIMSLTIAGHYVLVAWLGEDICVQGYYPDEDLNEIFLKGHSGFGPAEGLKNVDVAGGFLRVGSLEQAVLCYEGPDRIIKVRALKYQDPGGWLTTSSFDGGTLGETGRRRIAVACGNFDEDSFDEWVVGWEGPYHDLCVEVQDVWGRHGQVSAGTVCGDERWLDVATGDFDGDDQDEIVAIREDENAKLYIQVFDVVDLAPVPGACIADEAMSEGGKPSVATGDFNGNGFDEVAVAWKCDGQVNVKIYRARLSGLSPKGKVKHEEVKQFLNVAVGDFEILPKKPTAVAQALNTTTIKVTWDEQEEETKYRVEWSYYPGHGFQLLSEVSKDRTWIYDYDLYPGTTYYYRVRAENDFGESPWSDVVSARTPAYVLHLEAWYTGSRYSSAPKVRLNWRWEGDPPSVAYYDVFCDFGTGNFQWINPHDPVYGMQYDHDVTLEVCQSYTYKVVARPSDDESIPDVAHNSAPPSDPLVAISDCPEATGLNNGTRLALDKSGRIHMCYTDTDSVFYTYTDDGQIIAPPVAVGPGRYPSIFVDSKQNPNLVWMREITGYTGELYFSKLGPSGWTYPYLLFSGDLLRICPPSAVVARTDTAHITWTQSPALNFWEVNYGSFDLMQPEPSLVYCTYDTVTTDTAMALASIALDIEGGLNMVWNRAGEIYGIRKTETGFSDPINISNTPSMSTHPTISALGDRICMAWQEEADAGTLKVCYGTTWIGLGCEPVVTDYLRFPLGNGECPVTFGPLVAWSGAVLGPDYEVFSFLPDEFGDIVYTSLLTESYEPSKYPGITVRQFTPKADIAYVWTEWDPSGYFLVKMADPPIPPLPYYSADLGNPEPSRYTVQREGFKIWGMRAFQSADYHPEQLIYHFSKLDAEKKYSIKVVYYFEHDLQEEWEMMLVVDGIPMQNTKISPREKVVVEKWLPRATYLDGEIDVTVERLRGDYAICSEIFLFRFERTEGEGGSGLQLASAGGLKPSAFKLFQNRPNPTAANSTIAYQIPKDVHVGLQVYNVAGQVVRVLVNERRKAGLHSIAWDGKDALGKKVAPGVYFYRMEAGGFIDTGKIVLIH